MYVDVFKYNTNMSIEHIYTRSIIRLDIEPLRNA